MCGAARLHGPVLVTRRLPAVIGPPLLEADSGAALPVRLLARPSHFQADQGLSRLMLIPSTGECRRNCSCLQVLSNRSKEDDNECGSVSSASSASSKPVASTMGDDGSGLSVQDMVLLVADVDALTPRVRMRPCTPPFFKPHFPSYLIFRIVFSPASKLLFDGHRKNVAVIWHERHDDI